MTRKSIGFLLAVTLLISGQAFAYTVGNYVVWNDHTYVLLTAGTTDSKEWQSAQNAALNLGTGWNLASITSKEEQVFINSILPTVSSRSQVWVGGYQNPQTSPPDANWNWINGDTPTSFVNWGQNLNDIQPDDWGTGKNNGSQYYMALDSTFGNPGYGFQAWAWDDNTSHTNYIIGAVAEVSRPVPLPGAVWMLGAGLVGLVAVRRRNVT